MAVFVVGTGTVTYAWFLSRYSSIYEFELEANSTVILRYEEEVAYASGTISTAANILVPATAKNSSGGLTSENAQRVYEPMDMFATAEVERVAHAVHFTAKGAYWVGAGTTAGQFTPSLSATITNGNPDYDLVAWEEVDYFVIFTYLGEKVLYYDGTYYISTDEENATFTLPSSVVSAAQLFWRALTASDTVRYNSIDFALTDGTHLLLAPNSEFDMDIYVFIAKTDELLHEDMNGERLTLTAMMSVQ